MAKYIFVTGGVVSSLGKGITVASLGRLLESRGVKVNVLKLDPYINVDPGTMSPFQHGEVFVTEDGAESDLDLGHYERFMDKNLTRQSNITTGRIYWSIINKERNGEFLGKTVQVIPHVTNEIKSQITSLATDDVDVVMVEIGGTVGDIESLPFLESIRQFKNDVGKDSCLYIHVTLLPYLEAAQELKTKPTQHSVKELRSIGIQPDVIVCRSEHAIDKDVKEKIALFCDIQVDGVISNPNVRSIYEVPLIFQEQGLDELVVRMLNLPAQASDLSEWQQMVHSLNNPKGQIKIGIVGKYVSLPDAYLSVVEALRHAGVAHQQEVLVEWINAESVTKESSDELLGGLDGIIVPGGFGCRGVEGKIEAAWYARTRQIPFLGICLGMHCAVVEFARNVCNLDDANSREYNNATSHPVVDKSPDQRKVRQIGGTMCLGNWTYDLYPGSLAMAAYQSAQTSERHRYRYQVNWQYKDVLEHHGMRIAAVNQERNLIEIVELEEHPWFVACQFHPEFKSRPNRPHPLFKGLVEAALQRRMGTSNVRL
ncbi:MAG: CTP synthase [Limnochordia bacterium]|jgi:CTP synthase|nr:CTP synthase [Limnochordia bacterium]MDD2628775.1 CTP synthase [Limnochordia bacterium]MDD4517744.1 CTP synthase [Limnochordia bacterium]